MKQIGFIGAYDKINLLLYIAKVLTMFNKKVLIIDATTIQKARYIIPTLNPSASYITNFENIDVTVGLYSAENVCSYIGVNSFEQLNYDYVFIDIDHPNMFSRFHINANDTNFFVTAFDLYTLKKGVEILSGIPMPLNLTKVLFSSGSLETEDNYLNFLTLGMRLQWEEKMICFSLDNMDREIIINNEKSETISLKNISKEYKNSLAFIVSYISQISEAEVKNTIKFLEK